MSLGALIDTVQATGAKSTFWRDPQLHYYLRGLLWCARGEPDSAERTLRASLTSLSEGFTRENADLAALLIDRHRAAEAIPLVRLALQGPMEASNAYITRTELQALLARAFAQAGQAYSAAVYRTAARRRGIAILAGRGPSVRTGAIPRLTSVARNDKLRRFAR